VRYAAIPQRRGGRDASQWLRGLRWRVLTSSGYLPSARQNKRVHALFWTQSRSRTRACAQLREHIPDFTLGLLIPLRDPFSLRGGAPRLVVAFGAADLARDLRNRRVQNRDL
jgi:hypothetical protein